MNTRRRRPIKQGMKIQHRTHADLRVIHKINSMLRRRVEKGKIKPKEMKEIQTFIASFRRANGTVPTLAQLIRVFSFLEDHPVRKYRRKKELFTLKLKKG